MDDIALTSSDKGGLQVMILKLNKEFYNFKLNINIKYHYNNKQKKYKKKNKFLK
jgi:hypothetical protein